jgi:hypothetical protein
MSIRDLLPWQHRSDRGDSQTTPAPPNQSLLAGRAHRFSRRGFINTAAGATALALGPGRSLSALAHDNDHHQKPSAPKPIPGGLNLSGFGLVAPYDFIHTFAPGAAGVVLPYTGGMLQGLNVEPGTITDFQGDTAVAFHVGEAKGSDGNTYNLETDFRFMNGSYVAVDGSTRRGTFGLI